MNPEIRGPHIEVEVCGMANLRGVALTVQGCSDSERLRKRGDFAGRRYPTDLADVHTDEVDQAPGDQRLPLVGIVEELTHRQRRRALAADRLEPTDILRRQSILQEEQPVLLDVLGELDGIDGVETFVDIVEQFHVIAKLVPDMIDHRQDGSPVSARIEVIPRKRSVRCLQPESQLDGVLRVTPVTTAAPTWLGRLGLPLVVGPLNSGLGDPPGFGKIMRQESTWLTRIRHLSRAADSLLGSTRRAARVRAVAGGAVARIQAPAERQRFLITREIGEIHGREFLVNGLVGRGRVLHLLVRQHFGRRVPIVLVVHRDDALGLAVLRPTDRLAPPAIAEFQTGVPRLQAEVAVAGFPYGGVLTTPALTFGKLLGVPIQTKLPPNGMLVFQHSDGLVNKKTYLFVRRH